MKSLWNTKKNLVYLYEGPPPHLPSLPEGFVCRPITQSVLDQYFSSEADAARGQQYRGFLREGAEGYVITCGDRWASAAWLAPADVAGAPHHIPANVNTKHPWMYHDHTHPDFRRRGLHSYLVARRLNEAPQLDGVVTVATDINPSNVASRASYEAHGFAPAGALVTRQLQVPRLPRKMWGRWNKNVPHPPLTEGA